MIKKSEVLNMVSAEVKELCDRAEEIIDTILKTRYHGKPVYIDISEIGLSPAENGYEIIKLEIIKRYEADDNGWKVKFEYDQREGSWFTFS